MRSTKTASIACELIRASTAAAGLFALSGGLLWGQAKPAREYIYLGDKPIAIETQASTIAVSPAAIRVKAAGTQLFSVSTGSVIWSVNPGSGAGTMSPGGLYTAPNTVLSETSVTIEVRETVGGPVVGTATVVLEPATLLISPATLNLQSSGMHDFTANMAVSWSVNPDVGTVTSTNATTGHYVAPSGISSSQTVTLTATSSGNPPGNPPMSGTATITLLPATGQCTVTPTVVAWAATGSAQSVTLTCPAGYTWTASNSGATWVTLNVTSGTGSGAVTLTAPDLGGSGRRSGVVFVDGTEVTVEQNPNCTNTFSTSAFGSPGGAPQGTVACAAGVPWTSDTGGATWLHVVPASGTGTTSVSLQVDTFLANPTAARSATVTIQGSSFTITQYSPCTLTPASAQVFSGGSNSQGFALECNSLPAPWAVTGAPSWVTATPASGIGSAIFTITVDPNPSENEIRTATAGVDSKTLTITQDAKSKVIVAPDSHTLSVGENVQFVGTIKGFDRTTSLTWDVASGPGEFTGPTGRYVAPAIVLPNANVATIHATDVTGGGVGIATVTVNPYAPPTGAAVDPASGSALTQQFQFAVTNPSGAVPTQMIALFNDSLSTHENGCSVKVDMTTNPANAISVQENTGSNYTQLAHAGTVGSVENSQCRVQAGSSSVSSVGNTLYVQLQIEFKPGFIGQKLIGVQATNDTHAVMQMTQVGTWNLGANPAALPPNLAISTPAASETVTGPAVSIAGWALDNTTRVENVITSIQVYVDDTLQTGPVMRNQSSTICSTYPNRPGCPDVGWSYSWDSRTVGNGAHTIKVVVTDYDNPSHSNNATINVTVNNPPSTPITVLPESVMIRMYVGQGYNPTFQQFTAYRGSTTLNDVSWATVPNSSDGYYGSLTSSGVYTPPLLGHVTPGDKVGIRATNPSDSDDYGTSWPTLVGVLANGYNLQSLQPGQSVTFSSSLGAVTYTLLPNLGTINIAGTYTHTASSYTPGTIVKVTATSTGNLDKQETAYVQLQ